MIRNARYRHPYEFQIVIDAPMAQIADILGEFGYRVCAGYQFEPDDVLDDILVDDSPFRLDLHMDLQFRPVLRIVFQDGQGRWPEHDKCSYGYALQNVPTPLLLNPKLWRENQN